MADYVISQKLWDKLLMANKGDKDDQNAASNTSGRSAPPKGNVSTVNQPKVREQTKLGEYPKRRSDDKY